MTKRAKNAQEPAASQPETIGENQSPAGAELEAAALVEGDGGAAPSGAEHAGQAAGTDGGSAGPRLGDAGLSDAGGADAAVNVTDAGDGSGLGTALDDSDVPYGRLSDDKDTGRRNPAAGTGEAGDADAGALGHGGQHELHADGNADGQGPDAKAADGSLLSQAAAAGELTEETEFPAFVAADHHAENAEVARGVASMILDQVFRIMGNGQLPAWAVRERFDSVAGLTPAEYAEAARCLRAIGIERARVPVVESQLKIAGLRTEPLTMPEQIAMDAFLFCVAALDQAAASLEAAIARAAEDAARKPPPPVPIEDTTLETAGDMFETWR